MGAAGVRAWGRGGAGFMMLAGSVQTGVEGVFFFLLLILSSTIFAGVGLLDAITAILAFFVSLYFFAAAMEPGYVW
ncbi:hypothetical protein T484DRAFT_1835281 [Baffinella frigidus]|nr:hypothetical protein T484DRAFT_1835281 [Cryptophyta sp. CCMP2293]